MLSAFLQIFKKFKTEAQAPHSKLASRPGTPASPVLLPPKPEPGPLLVVRHVDWYYDLSFKMWRYRDTATGMPLEHLGTTAEAADALWPDAGFVVITTVPWFFEQPPLPQVIVRCQYMLKACIDVIQSWPTVQMYSNRLQIHPEPLITFFPDFIAYKNALASQESLSLEEQKTLSAISVLTSALISSYSSTFLSLDDLTSRGCITFPLLYALLVPRTFLVLTCRLTGRARLLRLRSWHRTLVDNEAVYQLFCESTEVVDCVGSRTAVVGRVGVTVNLRGWEGERAITSLDVVPLKYHPNAEGLKAEILERGKKWLMMFGVHHKQYEGVATELRHVGEDRLTKYMVKGRIMIDRVVFWQPDHKSPTPISPKLSIPVVSSNEQSHVGAVDEYGFPINLPDPQEQNVTRSYYSGATSNETMPPKSAEVNYVSRELSEEDVLLSPTVVVAYSFNEDCWMEFDVEKITDIQWNDRAIDDLLLPPRPKDTLRSLVQSSAERFEYKTQEQGLVIRLLGPSGVGKTHAVQAACESLHRPLYIFNADAWRSFLPVNVIIERFFAMAAAWKAVVLIKNVDLLVKTVPSHQAARNVRIQSLLRHTQYFPGIVFVSGTHSTIFESLLARHYAVLATIHLDKLSEGDKEVLWCSFIKESGPSATITDDSIKGLAKRNMNARQIRNAVRIANSLAAGHGKEVTYDYFADAADLADDPVGDGENAVIENEFDDDFSSISQ